MLIVKFITAISSMGMTLSIDNLVFSSYLGAGLGVCTTLIVNGTVQFTYDPAKAQAE